MEKIRRAAMALGNMHMELSALKAATFVLCDSLANGGAEMEDIITTFTFDLSNKTEAFEKKYQKLTELLCEGLREVDV